jgi:hypothetical protein
MANDFEDRIIRKQWKLYAIENGTKIYTKISEKLTNIAFVRDDHWYNYCVFKGDEPYLHEILAFFLVDCKMKEDWKRHTKNGKA